MEQKQQARRKRTRKVPLQTTPTQEQRAKVEQIAAQFHVPTADVLRWAIDAFDPAVFFAGSSAPEKNATPEHDKAAASTELATA